MKLAEKPTNTYFQPAELFIILPVYIFYPIGPSSSGKTRAFGARIPQVRILSAQLPYKLPLKLKKVAVFLLTRPTGFEPKVTASKNASNGATFFEVPRQGWRGK